MRDGMGGAGRRDGRSREVDTCYLFPLSSESQLNHRPVASIGVCFV